MSRPTNPPEDASGMRCLGCGYYDDEPQAQRMCEVGEGAGHAFVRVGPDGCVPAPDDDPAEVHIPPRHGKSALTGMFGDPDSWDALHNDVDGAAVSVPDDPATLRARLEERYERPERPCTYDPADEEPEAEPVAPTPEDRLRSHLRALDRLHVSRLGPVVRYTPPEDPGTFPGVGHWPDPTESRAESDTRQWRESQATATWNPRFVPEPPTPHPADCQCVTCYLYRIPFDLGAVATPSTDWTPPRPEPVEYPAVAPQGGPDPLRSYLRTLTDPDATAEDVNGALDALTPEDRALVSEALPSWGSARMSRVEAIAPFMARFEAMVRERDPRANEEGALLLSALREDDPTRSTIVDLMRIAKTPKVRE